jgi:hypothetical protein
VKYFKYTDALKMTKEKRASFINKIAKASKGEATVYTAGAGAGGAYAGLRAGEAYDRRTLTQINRYYMGSTRKLKHFGAIAGGALGAGVAANYFIRKNI